MVLLVLGVPILVLLLALALEKLENSLLPARDLVLSDGYEVPDRAADAAAPAFTRPG